VPAVDWHSSASWRWPSSAPPPPSEPGQPCPLRGHPGPRARSGQDPAGRQPACLAGSGPDDCRDHGGVRRADLYRTCQNQREAAVLWPVPRPGGACARRGSGRAGSRRSRARRSVAAGRQSVRIHAAHGCVSCQGRARPARGRQQRCSCTCRGWRGGCRPASPGQLGRDPWISVMRSASSSSSSAGVRRFSSSR
jgi:hypothetical protein